MCACMYVPCGRYMILRTSRILASSAALLLGLSMRTIGMQIHAVHGPSKSPRYSLASPRVRLEWDACCLTTQLSYRCLLPSSRLRGRTQVSWPRARLPPCAGRRLLAPDALPRVAARGSASRPHWSAAPLGAAACRTVLKARGALRLYEPGDGVCESLSAREQRTPEAMASMTVLRDAAHRAL